jgi:hypothetical protein
MLTLTQTNLDLNSGIIHCVIICSLLGISAEIKPTIVEADVITFNGGGEGWTQETIQAYLASLTPPVIVSLPN